MSGTTTLLHQGTKRHKPWLSIIWSFVPLVVYVVFEPVFLQPRRHTQDWVMGWTGLMIGFGVVLNAGWWFFRCPRRYWVLKAVTLVALVLSLAISIGCLCSRLAYKLYGVTP